MTAYLTRKPLCSCTRASPPEALESRECSSWKQWGSRLQGGGGLDFTLASLLFSSLPGQHETNRGGIWRGCLCLGYLLSISSRLSCQASLAVFDRASHTHFCWSLTFCQFKFLLLYLGISQRVSSIVPITSVFAGAVCLHSRYTSWGHTQQRNRGAG